MRKNKILTTSLREIKLSYKRFISIILMSLLGVCTFVGLSSSAPDMMQSLDSYYDRTNFYDIKLISTLGISDNVVSEIRKINGVKDVTPSNSKDVLSNINGKDKIIKLIGITDNVNKIELKSGRMPSFNNEILVEEAVAKNDNVKLEDIITINAEGLKFKRLKVVGFIKSPLYISSSNPNTTRGNTNIGSGKINYYAYVNNNLFEENYYTEVYITVDNAKEDKTNSSSYNDKINKVLNRINKNKKYLEDIRYNEIYNEAYNKIKKEEDKGLYELSLANNKLQDAKLQLDNGKEKLDNTKIMLDNSYYELNKNKTMLDNSKDGLNKYNEALDESKNKLNFAINKINDELSDYNIDYNYVVNLISVLDKKTISKEEMISIVPNNITNYDEIVKVINDSYDFDMNSIIDKEVLLSYIPNDTDNYDEITNYINNLYNFKLDNISTTKNDVIGMIPESLTNYDDIVSTINILYDKSLLELINNTLDNEDEIDVIINNLTPELNDSYVVSLLTKIKEVSKKILELENAVVEIENAKIEYNKRLEEYNDLLSKYNSGYSLYMSYLNEYNNGYSLYQSGLNTYYSSLNLYNKSIKEYYESRALFDSKINEAKEKLNDIPESKLYVYNRLDNTDYSNFIDDGNSVSNLSKLFPTVFFVVSILISLVSMSRMVEDDRLLIGTLKSLGFSNKHIMIKYMLYASLATIIGAILGSLIGFFVLTYYIFNIYKLLFSIERFVIDYDLHNVIIGSVISIICICGTTYLTVRRIVKEKPSDLMRPKAPGKGKRVLLERIPFIWNKLSFSNKVTVRNLFRYKKRALMTIVGILGCTSLLLAGFGIRDSIVDIPSTQYGEVFKFDEMVYVTDDYEPLEIFKDQRISNFTETKVLTGTYKKYNINIMTFNDENKISNIINLRDLKTSKRLTLKENEVIISDKLSYLTSSKVGDDIIFKDNDGKEYSFKVSGIYENYVGNYIFMNKRLYEQNFGKYQTNIVFVNLNNIKDENEISKEIVSSENVMSLVSIDSTIKEIGNMLKTLNSVVFILILLSGVLTFVVLYNLSYININERKREMATLKVLGFTNKEVDGYVNKEMIILTSIGIIFGLLFGIILTNIIVNTVEIDMVRFIHRINTISYILTIIIITIFTLIVSIISHFSLKKIDMIESLKSIE